MRRETVPVSASIDAAPGAVLGALTEGGHMVRSAIKFTRDQREAIYQAFRPHLVGLSDGFTLLDPACKVFQSSRH